MGALSNPFRTAHVNPQLRQCSNFVISYFNAEGMSIKKVALTAKAGADIVSMQETHKESTQIR